MEVFRRLFPDPAGDLTAADLAAEAPGRPGPERPWVLLNMIATADGRTTIDGRAGPIANPADAELLHALRRRCDAVMVGAETIRVEGYGAMEEIAVVVSRRVDLPTETGVLSHPGNRAVIITPSPDAELPPCAADVSYVREADLGRALARLRAEHGVDSIACEGGAGLNGTLIPAGLVDELYLVYAPKLSGGADPLTMLTGPPLDPPLDLELISLHESAGYLFARYGL